MRRNLIHALAKGQLEDAEHLLRHLRTADPISKETRCLELEMLIKLKNLAQAERLAAQLVECFPGSSRICWLSGQVHFHQKNYRAALPLFEESLRLSFRPVIQWWLGRTLLRLGDLTGARHVLEQVKENIPRALLDLAWLEEREGDLGESLKYYEKFLRLFPEDGYAKQAIIRLNAARLEPDKLLQEMESLKQWGETVPAHLLPVYISRLLELGEGAKARNLVAQSNFPLNQAIQAAWICYKARAYDLAFELFRPSLAENLKQFKFLNALENAAEKCGRLREVIEDYEKLVSVQSALYGRIAKLKRKLEKELTKI